ncbi:rCG61595 [Rattus norvegicus]|uniref:RCG61595 n=1 Tax=Rattus norvegicus TaxID=10116 RepID=A6HC48_RAT|nr:rCG61595 [Rattus norvegicus]
MGSKPETEGTGPKRSVDEGGRIASPPSCILGYQASTLSDLQSTPRPTRRSPCLSQHPLQEYKI